MTLLPYSGNDLLTNSPPKSGNMQIKLLPDKLISYLCIRFNFMIDMEDINRLKLVLVEKKKTDNWLAE